MKSGVAEKLTKQLEVGVRVSQVTQELCILLLQLARASEQGTVFDTILLTNSRD